jgi:hypothetical protein
MNFIPRDATDHEILEIIRHWIDVLAREGYGEIFDALGYSMLYQYEEPGLEVIRNAIKRYRSPEFFPNIEDFVVTDWKTANGGNPSPVQNIVWYKPGQALRGAISVDLPLNGRWSDLEADFVWFENSDLSKGYPLRLEEISSFAQTQCEIDDSP